MFENARLDSVTFMIQCTDYSAAHRKQQVNIRRPKLLFLAWCFPPAKSIASVRSWNIAKYLVRLGWEITVVTPAPSLWRNVEDPQKVMTESEREGIRCIPTGHRWSCLSPDLLKSWNKGLGWVAGGVCRRIARYLGVESEIGWFGVAEQACSTLTPDDVDVILATGSPFFAFILAKRLSDRLARPYVLDYRDPWTENPTVAAPSPAARIRKEARLVAGAAAVTIVSCSWGSAMDHRFHLGPRLHVVTNGYDPEELANVAPHDFGHRAIVYAGVFHPPKRVISPVMASLKRLKETRTGSDWYFHYYGDWGDYVRQEADRFGVMERVVLHGNRPRAEVLSAVRGANVVVVISSALAEGASRDRGWIPGKLFEPFGFGTPILLIAPPGSDAKEIVEETGMGGSFAGTDIEGIVAFISNSARIDNKRGNCTDKYSWPSLATKLDEILRGVVEQRQLCVGTAAREVINGKSYGRTADWAYRESHLVSRRCSKSIR
jgi:glycosyltransferase involved in cell wall biosynthesis